MMPAGQANSWSQGACLGQGAALLLTCILLGQLLLVDGSLSALQRSVRVSSRVFNSLEPNYTAAISTVAPLKPASPCSSCAVLTAISAAKTAVSFVVDVNANKLDLSDLDLQYCSPGKPYKCGKEWSLEGAITELTKRLPIQSSCLDAKLALQAQHNSTQSICSFKKCKTVNALAAAGSFSYMQLRSRWEIQQHIRTFGAVAAVLAASAGSNVTREAGGNAKQQAALIVGYNQDQGYWIVSKCAHVSASQAYVKVAFGASPLPATMAYGIVWQPLTGAHDSAAAETPIYGTANASVVAPAAHAAKTQNLQVAFPSTAQHASLQQELQALLDIRRALDTSGRALPVWTASNGANNRYCSWPGVYCNERKQVALINLVQFVPDLAGMLPSAAVLAKLPALTAFMVGPSSNLAGSLPSDWSTLTKLEEIAVVDTAVSGPLPGSWGNLKNLERLRLWRCRVSGPLPASWGNMTSINQMQLSVNGITGTLPESWAGLSDLIDLRVADNNLSAEVPAGWGSGMTSLQELHLEINAGLSGCIPREFKDHPKFNVDYSATAITGFC